MLFTNQTKQNKLLGLKERTKLASGTPEGLGLAVPRAWRPANVPGASNPALALMANLASTLNTRRLLASHVYWLEISEN